MKQVSGLDDHVMLRFNCVIGMVLILEKDVLDEAKALLKGAGEGVVYNLGCPDGVLGEGEQVEMESNLA